jgi:hypothetical protein
VGIIDTTLEDWSDNHVITNMNVKKRKHNRSWKLTH